MQVCTSLQPDNHASTPPLSFLQAGCPSCHPTNSVKALMGTALKGKQLNMNGIPEAAFAHQQTAERCLVYTKVAQKLAVDKSLDLTGRQMCTLLHHFQAKCSRRNKASTTGRHSLERAETH